MDVPTGQLFLGDRIDPVTGKRLDKPVLLDAADLTTHGVIVGMTGSGKTGLAVVLMEEALLSGVPCLILDPKGDLSNLLLNFPDLSAESFRPWINEGEAQREGRTPDEHAAAVAQTWREGLAAWGIDPARMQQLKDRADITLYTPGSTAGIPINVIGDLRAPDGVDEEALGDEIEGFVSSLLGLVGIEGDPLSSREHILLSNIVHSAWSEGRDLDLAELVGAVQNPPMRKLGVLELDTFFPPKDRNQLALKLNGLLASPAFGTWLTGAPLDIGGMLDGASGKPAAAIVSLAHLSDAERQFVVTLVLAKAVTWFRKLPGTPDLRALIYMDEVFGFVPPTAQPPSKKPILTIFKQARAFGVGMVLATQNPVDLDYKAISNAGTWMIGRLQTERDKARLLEGMQSAGGSVDLGELDATISGLGKRQFLLHTAKRGTEGVFTTRWAMSYLAGPLTREQLARIDRPETISSRPDSAPRAAPRVADDETTVAPTVAPEIEVFHVHPSAPWLETIGGTVDGPRLQAGLAAKVSLLYDEERIELRHEAEWATVLFPLTQTVDPRHAMPVAFDERHLTAEAPRGASYVLPDAPIQTKAYWRDAEAGLKDHLYRTLRIELQQNTGLKLTSRIDEPTEQFAARCVAAASDQADAEIAKFDETQRKKIDKARDDLARANDALRERKTEKRGRRFEFVARIVEIGVGALAGRRSRKSATTGWRANRSAAAKEATAENRVEDLEEQIKQLQEEQIEAEKQIRDRWDAEAAKIEALPVALEKADVRVSQLCLVWIPTR